MKYMLDTNICIYIIKKNPHHVLKKFKDFEIGDICISSITFSELMYGVKKSAYPQKNEEALFEFASPLEIVSFDAGVADYYGEIRTYLEKKGTPVGALDLMIAAHALYNHTILVTNNEKEFLRVPNLKIENWAA